MYKLSCMCVGPRSCRQQCWCCKCTHCSHLQPLARLQCLPPVGALDIAAASHSRSQQGQHLPIEVLFTGDCVQMPHHGEDLGLAECSHLNLNPVLPPQLRDASPKILCYTEPMTAVHRHLSAHQVTRHSWLPPWPAERPGPRSAPGAAPRAVPLAAVSHRAASEPAPASQCASIRWQLRASLSTLLYAA